MSEDLSVLAFLAFDLGSSGGRAIVGRYDGGRIDLEVIHRFANGPVRVHSADC